MKKLLFVGFMLLSNLLVSPQILSKPNSPKKNKSRPKLMEIYSCTDNVEPLKFDINLTQSKVTVWREDQGQWLPHGPVRRISSINGRLNEGSKIFNYELTLNDKTKVFLSHPRYATELTGEVAHQNGKKVAFKSCSYKQVYAPGFFKTH